MSQKQELGETGRTVYYFNLTWHEIHAIRANGIRDGQVSSEQVSLEAGSTVGMLLSTPRLFRIPSLLASVLH